MAEFSDSVIRAFQGGSAQGREDGTLKTFGQYAPKARQGDQSAWDELYKRDPAQAGKFEEHFSQLDDRAKKELEFVQDQAGRLAYGVLQEQDPARIGPALLQSLDQLEGSVKGTRIYASMKPQIDQLRQLAAGGDPQAIAGALTRTLQNSMAVSDRLKMMQPKTAAERAWEVIRNGDPASPEYMQADYELFGKPTYRVDPVDGQMKMVPKGERPAGVRPPTQGRPTGAPSSYRPPVTSAPLAAPAPAPARQPLTPRPAGPNGFTQTDAGGAAPPPPTINQPAPQLAPRAPAPARGTDAFGNPLGAEPAADRRATAKDARKAYEEQRQKNAEASVKANTTRSKAGQFAQLNEKLNKKGSGEIGTGGAMSIPGASTLVGAVDSDVARMNAIVADLIPKQREPGAGATSDFDAKMFGQALFGADKPYGANKAIAAALVEQARNTTNYMQFFDNYYKARGSIEGVDSAWQTYLDANPVMDPNSAEPRLNPSRQSWQAFFANQGLGGGGPAPQAAPAPSTRPTNDTLSPDFVKKNPGRFVPIN